MLDSDLAELYQVETKAMNRAVKRNIERFPQDFMFRLSKSEWENLRCQFGTSSYGGRRYAPYFFTEQGIAMLSSVLNSKRAIQVNIQIMRTFIGLREMLLTHKELREKIDSLEAKYENRFKAIFDVIKKIIQAQEVTEKNDNPSRIGFE